MLRAIHGMDGPCEQFAVLPARHPEFRRLDHRPRAEDGRAHRPGRFHAGAHDHHEIQQARFVEDHVQDAGLRLARAIEPRLALRAVRDAVADRISEEELVQHLVAITDPGSMLERQAREEGWAAVFSGQPTVGGRFSALSVFGLLPAALVGIDLEEFMAHAIDAERQCSEDAIDNPAIGLASFLYDNYLQGRNKFTFLTQKRGRVLGLWIEQLVAESLGKDGQGILPNIEVDSLLLKKDPGDRSAIVYLTRNDLWDERRNFEMSLSYIDPSRCAATS